MIWSLGNAQLKAAVMTKFVYICDAHAYLPLGVFLRSRSWQDLPAAVAHFYEFQDVFCALDLLLLKPHNLHLLFPVLQHPQLRFAIQQVKNLTIQTHNPYWLMFSIGGEKKQQMITHHLPFHCRFRKRLHTLVDLTSCSWVSSTWEKHPELKRNKKFQYFTKANQTFYNIVTNFI